MKFHGQRMAKVAPKHDAGSNTTFAQVPGDAPQEESGGEVAVEAAGGDEAERKEVAAHQDTVQHAPSPIHERSSQSSSFSNGGFAALDWKEECTVQEIFKQPPLSVAAEKTETYRREDKAPAAEADHCTAFLPAAEFNAAASTTTTNHNASHLNGEDAGPSTEEVEKKNATTKPKAHQPAQLPRSPQRGVQEGHRHRH
ncbi:hypothetical protein Tc00.1047053506279.100 [Trypanosoma cruzi]|uniref:Uncharacterized protein n=1 Tax=Trypanosoma cruzi (strain CL Brener) TaxID=353153 RepID=Q4DRK2_TRYCC|nr:hypothetical protein Tc00.1047053506279.100 [Trypanosoma cruzi]EAN95154.1 hypothetical protein Tc00.1047053506279.100 [Trypanosoma cruzi]|eukprot:XP_817005.1 hypothetical protein [Trypanosoma cruzi strain CL Brener]